MAISKKARRTAICIALACGGIIPCTVYELGLFSRTIWHSMISDRAIHLAGEKKRKVWNAKAKEEARLQRNALAILNQWAWDRGIANKQMGPPAHLVAQIEKVWFPKRHYQRHEVMQYFCNLPSQLLYRYFDAGPASRLWIEKEEWDAAVAKVQKDRDPEQLAFKTLEEIFWVDEPPAYRLARD